MPEVSIREIKKNVNHATLLIPSLPVRLGRGLLCLLLLDVLPVDVVLLLDDGDVGGDGGVDGLDGGHQLGRVGLRALEVVLGGAEALAEVLHLGLKKKEEKKTVFSLVCRGKRNN